MPMFSRSVLSPEPPRKGELFVTIARPLSGGSVPRRNRHVAVAPLVEAPRPLRPRPRIVHIDPRRPPDARPQPARGPRQEQVAAAEIHAVRARVQAERGAQLSRAVGEA